jgi:hypothetical protein
MDRHQLRLVLSRMADTQHALLGHIVTADAARAALFRLVERLAGEVGVVALDGVPLAEWYAHREVDAVQRALELLETGSPTAAARVLEILDAIRAAADEAPDEGNEQDG